MERKYLPTFAELVDRLSICLLKSVFIPANRSTYLTEIQDIITDLNTIIKEKSVNLTGEMIRAMLVTMLANRYIWENESKIRDGTSQDLDLLKITHSINGVRNTAKNVISHTLGERKDLKIDCLAAELTDETQNWNIFL